MPVELSDGKCRTCGGQLKIIAADDATMDVECTERNLPSYCLHVRKIRVNGSRTQRDLTRETGSVLNEPLAPATALSGRNALPSNECCIRIDRWRRDGFPESG